jgi:outer membrane protein OmpA-like peptidoglycan-associated protein
MIMKQLHLRFFCSLFLMLPALLVAQYQKENLGALVNSEYAELSPTISPDGKKLFFLRVNHPENTLYPQPGTQDIWMSKLDSTGNWTAARHLKAPFNDENYNAIEGFSADGNTRYIKGYYVRGQYDGMGFSYFELTKDGWKGPTGIKLPGYQSAIKPEDRTISSYIHTDNQTLLMSFVPDQRKKTDHDLYMSFRKENGNFSEPELIPIVSSPYDEIGPFLASDGVTLYFASDRPGGYGSHDIWMSRRLDDTWKNWSEPVNLGPEINTKSWDAYYSVAAAGDVAYMVSSDNGYGKSDIVRIKLKEEVRPNPVALVSGKVLDQKTGKPVEATITYYSLANNVEVGTARSSPGTGDYSIVLPYGKAYGFRAQADGYYAQSENLDLTGLKAYEEIKRNLYLVPIEIGQVVRLNNIFFEFGKATLKPESYEELDRVVKLLTENPTMEIDLAGHTDNVGTDEANQQLSEDRSKAVYDYLTTKGILASRLSTKGFGETKAIATNDSEDGRAQNRRVEFTIRKK